MIGNTGPLPNLSKIEKFVSTRIFPGNWILNDIKRLQVLLFLFERVGKKRVAKNRRILFSNFNPFEEN